jgi:hypothetical protein
MHYIIYIIYAVLNYDTTIFYCKYNLNKWKYWWIFLVLRSIDFPISLYHFNVYSVKCLDLTEYMLLTFVYFLFY